MSSIFEKTFSLRIPYDSQCVEDLQQIMGRSYDKKTRETTFPAVEIFEVADAVSSYFPNLAERLKTSAKFEKEREMAKDAIHMIYLSRAKKTRFKSKCPEGLEPRAFQNAGVYYATYEGRDNVLIADEMGLGKEQPLTAKLLTPFGWKTMGDARIGMGIIGSDGKMHFIKGVYPQGKKPAYRISFSDGTSTECGLDHLWRVSSHNRITRKQPDIVKTTREILKGGVLNKHGYCKWFVPLVKPIKYANENLPLDPYVLGALIGDGYLVGPSIVISVPDEKIEILNRIKTRLPNGVKISPHKRFEGACPQYGLITSEYKSSIMNDTIKNLGLNVKSPFRFIPEIYLKGSPEDRLEILRGLMDTDGNGNRNRINFCTTSKQLADDVKTLTQSLGGIAWVNEFDRSDENKSTEYRTTVRIEICPFHLKYKAAGWEKPIRSKRKWIEKIEYIGEVEQQCISVTAKDNLYVTDDFIVTHNTVEAILVANELGARRALFIGPSSAKINWQREILKWSTETQDVSVIEASSRPEEIKEHNYISINYDILARHEETLKSIRWDIVVGDEAHMIKNPDAKRTQIATNLCDAAGYVALLTGSPIVNRPYELWNLINTLNPIFWQNWYDFVMRYCDAKTNPYTGRFEYKGAKHMAELQDKLRMTVMLRRLKKDVLKDLPPKTRQIVEIPATRKFSTLLAAQEKYVGKLRKIIDVMEDVKKSENFEEQEAKFRERIKKSGHISPSEFEDMAKLRRLTALAKAPEVAEFADSILESKPKIGIYAYHQDVQKFFIDHFKKKAVHIIAGMTTKQRQLAVDRFQTDPSISVFVGSIMAAGTAITLTAADVCIMTEVHVVPGINSQVEDRFHRIGTINPVLIYYTMLQNSVDYYLANMFIAKQEIIEKALDTKTSLISRKRGFR